MTKWRSCFIDFKFFAGLLGSYCTSWGTHEWYIWYHNKHKVLMWWWWSLPKWSGQEQCKEEGSVYSVGSKDRAEGAFGKIFCRRLSFTFWKITEGNLTLRFAEDRRPKVTITAGKRISRRFFWTQPQLSSSIRLGDIKESKSQIWPLDLAQSCSQSRSLAISKTQPRPRRDKRAQSPYCPICAIRE